MPNRPHEITAQVVVEATRNLFKTLAGKYGGDCTLNELRVMNQIVRCHLEGRYCSVTALHKITGIPISTVSRTVANLRIGGWLTERQDPTDGRKRIVSLGHRSLDETFDDIDKSIRWINDFREHGLPT